MFSYIRGTVEELSAGEAVLDVSGLGFLIRTTASTAAGLKVGSPAKLFTYVYIREDIFEIYGFESKQERRCFEALLGVSGVGPKAALSVLSANSPEGLILAVSTGDARAIMAASGVGKKLAQRILLELKDKLAGDVDTVSLSDAAPAPAVRGSKRGDAAAALAALGYSPSEAAFALKGIDLEALSLEDVIKTALRQMAQP